ncbi:hypothetical protein E3N88_18340 [Mikania micrantha]|uniref:Uncharacterized protein n=1 Tax=Mikania micrantha TaxID=192012 RepID=A0A5N6NV12_9ASTR|nr:hypothetical protein E3N88_18340 [Mikania micrantha]
MRDVLSGSDDEEEVLIINLSLNGGKLVDVDPNELIDGEFTEITDKEVDEDFTSSSSKDGLSTYNSMAIILYCPCSFYGNESSI